MWVDYKLQDIKICPSCARRHIYISRDMVIGVDDTFIWWNCKCQSTLVVPPGEADEIID
jgi:hypothetical protein